MAKTQIKATAELFLDTSNAKSDAKKFVADLKEKLSSIETAADKMTVFKDLVGYIAQMDKALGALKDKHGDAFKTMFEGMDADFVKEFEALFGLSGKGFGKLTALREQLATLTPKSGIAEIRKFAEALNSLFVMAGKEPILNLDDFKNTRATQQHIDQLTAAVDRFDTVWTDVAEKVKQGFSFGGSGGGAGGTSDAIEKEIDKLEKQKKRYETIINLMDAPNHKYKQKTTVENDVKILRQLIDQYSKLSKELNDTAPGGFLQTASAEEINKKTAERVRIATALVNTAEYVNLHGSDEGAELAVSDIVNKEQDWLDTFYVESQKTASNISALYKKMVDDVNTQISKLRTQKDSGDGSSGTGVGGDARQLVKTYDDLLKIVDKLSSYSLDEIDIDDEKVVNLIKTLKELYATEEQFGDVDSIAQGLMNAELSSTEALEKLKELFGIEIPQSIKTAEEKYQSFKEKVSERNTAGFKDELDAGQYLSNMELLKNELQDLYDQGRITKAQFDEIQETFDNNVKGYVDAFMKKSNVLKELSDLNKQATQTEDEKGLGNIVQKRREIIALAEKNGVLLDEQLAEEKAITDAIEKRIKAESSESKKDDSEKQDDEKSDDDVAKEKEQYEKLKETIKEVEAAIKEKTAAFEEEGVTVDAVVEKEIAALRKLLYELGDVETAIDSKTEAFKSEGTIVDQVVEGEIGSLRELESAIKDIGTALDTAFAERKLNLPDVQNGLDDLTNINQIRSTQNDEFVPYRLDSGQAETIVSSKIDEKTIKDWYLSKADYKARDYMGELALSDKELRNATLNILYDKYLKSGAGSLSFDDFVNSDITVWRGTSKQKEAKSASGKFTSFSLSEERARQFAENEVAFDKTVETMLIPYTTKIKDVIGSFTDKMSSELELFVPRDNIKELASKKHSFDNSVLSESASENDAASGILQSIQSILGQIYGVLQGFTGIKADNENSAQYKGTSPERQTGVQSLNDSAQALGAAADEIRQSQKSDLVALHGLSTQNLIKALNDGAFPSPSIAVTKPEVYPGGYGEATVVFKKSAIDPANNPANKIYGVDAYTPTYPSLGYELNPEGLIRASERTGIEIDNLRFACDGAYENIQQAVKRLAYNDGIGADLREAFIKERELAINTVEVDERMRERFHMDGGDIHNPVQDILLREGITYDDVLRNDDIRKEYLDAVDKYVSDYNAQYEDLPQVKIKDYIVNAFKDRFNAALSDPEIYALEKEIFEHDQAVLRGERKTIDQGERYREIQKVVTDHSEEYNQYVEDILSDIMVKPNVRGAKGQRFDRTPEGIAAAISSYGGKNALYDEDPFMRRDMDDQLFIIGAAKDYKSIAEVEADAGRLQKDAPGTHTKLDNGYIQGIARAVAQANNIDQQDAFDKITKAVDGNTTAEAIGKALRNSGLTVDDATINKLAVSAQEAANVNTRYFEAKPQRALGLEDIEFVSVPKGANQLMSLLDSKGIKYVEQDPTDNASREAALKEGVQKYGEEDVANAREQLRIEQQITAEKKQQTSVEETDTTNAVEAQREATEMEQLAAQVRDVEAAVQAKTDAFTEEGTEVNRVVTEEIAALDRLISKLVEVKAAVEAKTDAFTAEGAAVSDVVAKEAAAIEAEETADNANEIKQEAQARRDNADAMRAEEAAQEKANDTKRYAIDIAREYWSSKGTLSDKQLDAFSNKMVDKALRNAFGQNPNESNRFYFDDFSDDVNDPSHHLEKYKAIDNILQLIGYHLGEMQTKTDGGFFADVIADSDRAVTNFDEARKILFNIGNDTGIEQQAAAEQKLADAAKETAEAKEKQVDAAKQAGNLAGERISKDTATKLSGKLNSSFDKSLGFSLTTPLDQSDALTPERQKIIQLYKEAANKVDELKKNSKTATDAQVNDAQRAVKALTDEIDAYKQRNNLADLVKNNTGNTTQATGTYNRLKSQVGSEEFANSKVVQEKFTTYEQAYNKMLGISKQLAGQDMISPDQKQEFVDAQKACNGYAKDLENLLKTSTKFKDDAMPSKSLNNFVDDIQNRKTALREFVQETYGAKAEIGGFGKNFESLNYIVKNGDGTFTNMVATLNSTRTTINATAKGAGQAKGAWSSFFDEVKAKARSIGTYLLSMTGFQELWQAVRQGVTYVREIDSALTELKKVTNETDATYKAFLQTMSNTAGNVGSTVTNLTSSAADWARLNI